MRLLECNIRELLESSITGEIYTYFPTSIASVDYILVRGLLDYVPGRLTLGKLATVPTLVSMIVMRRSRKVGTKEKNMLFLCANLSRAASNSLIFSTLSPQRTSHLVVRGQGEMHMLNGLNIVENVSKKRRIKSSCGGVKRAGWVARQSLSGEGFGQGTKKQ